MRLSHRWPALWRLALSRSDCVTLAAVPRRSSRPGWGRVPHRSSRQTEAALQASGCACVGLFIQSPACDASVVPGTGLPAPSRPGPLTPVLGHWRHFLALLVYLMLSTHPLARGGLGFLISLWEEEWRETPRHCVHGLRAPLFLGGRTPGVVHCYGGSATAGKAPTGVNVASPCRARPRGCWCSEQTSEG